MSQVREDCILRSHYLDLFTYLYLSVQFTKTKKYKNDPYEIHATPAVWCITHWRNCPMIEDQEKNVLLSK